MTSYSKNMSSKILSHTIKSLTFAVFFSSSSKFITLMFLFNSFYFSFSSVHSFRWCDIDSFFPLQTQPSFGQRTFRSLIMAVNIISYLKSHPLLIGLRHVGHVTFFYFFYYHDRIHGKQKIWSI